MDKEKFWNDLFSSKDKSSYYHELPSLEVIEVADLLNQNSSVLDLGCGMGKSPLYLAEKGFTVTAVDFSSVAIDNLYSECKRRGLEMQVIKQNLTRFRIDRNYDLIIAHGSLHFLNRRYWTKLITEMKEHTSKGGYNIITAFTDRILSPRDMEETLGDLFKEGELCDLYQSWQIIHWDSYIKKDEHPNNIKHEHPINKIVARKISDNRSSYKLECHKEI